jgi:hypothetical protein
MVAELVALARGSLDDGWSALCSRAEHEERGSGFEGTQYIEDLRRVRLRWTIIKRDGDGRSPWPSAADDAPPDGCTPLEDAVQKDRVESHPYQRPEAQWNADPEVGCAGGSQRYQRGGDGGDHGNDASDYEAARHRPSSTSLK